MALIVCPDCKREVSPQAVACPHCGRPMRAPKVHEGFVHQLAKAGCLAIGVVFLLFVSFCSWANLPDSSSGTTNSNAINRRSEAKQGNTNSGGLENRSENKVTIR